MDPPADQVPPEAQRVFKIPEKQIKSPMDMARWEKSECYYDILGFVSSISLIVQNKKLTDPINISPVVQKILNMIQGFESLARETPPIEQPQRFGNVAFRAWFEKMKLKSLNYIKEILPENLQSAAPELVCYVVESFGNSTRIDYGTGHELAFVMFLMCLFKIDALKKEDELAIGLKVFNEYINFARKLQVTYRMEPAGSHGVWSLDDYQFIPFIFGSAQLAYHSPIDPVAFVENETIDKYKSDYMFISCIDYIRQVKTGNFAEHSNQLWSISAVPHWSKICTGLIKMYQKEVLSKYPCVQHVLFGSILTLTPVKPGTMLPTNLRFGVPQTNRTTPNSIVPQ